MDLPLARVQQICSTFPDQRLVVIGDIMLDHFIVGDARRISPEAPIPVVDFINESYSPGGAGNVARNLSALGCKIDLFGIAGADANGDLLSSALSQLGLDTRGLIREPQRPTTVKTRITARRHQIVRLDRETSRPLAPKTAADLSAAWRAALPGANAVILADYAKGTIDQSLVDAVMAESRALGLPVFVDPKPSRHLNLHGCAVLTPNRKEAFELAGLSDPGSTASPTADSALLDTVARIFDRHAPDVLLITLSETGLLLIEKNGQPTHLPTFARQVFDVTGAGDTVIATFALARAAGATAFEAATLANYTAGIVVGKIGTAAATTTELLDQLARPPETSSL